MGLMDFFTLRERIKIDHIERPTAGQELWGDLTVRITGEAGLVRRVRGAVQEALVADVREDAARVVQIRKP